MTNKDAALNLAKALIACASITPQDAGCEAIITSRLESLGFKCEHFIFENVHNLWARYGTQAPLFVFAGHTDVVPPGPLDQWISPPFSPTVRDGYLYGRGAVDMKGGLAASIIAAENFVKAHPNFQGSIAFLITSDEEGPAINGTKKVMETLTARGEKIDYCIIGEPSSNQKLGDQIRIGRRGSLHGKLKVLGKQGHVAHPHLAQNPIHQSLAALEQFTANEWDQGNTDYPPTSLQISNMHSGTGAANVIPGILEILFNFRFGTASTTDSLKNRTKTYLDQIGLVYELEWVLGAAPFLTNRGNLLTASIHAIQTLTGLEPTCSTGGGTSDGRFIAPTGAEVIELGLSHATAHHVNEGVSVADLQLLTDIYEHILHTLLK